MTATVPRPPEHRGWKAIKWSAVSGPPRSENRACRQVEVLERYANTSEFPQKLKEKTNNSSGGLNWTNQNVEELNCNLCMPMVTGLAGPPDWRTVKICEQLKAIAKLSQTSKKCRTNYNGTTKINPKIKVLLQRSIPLQQLSAALDRVVFKLKP